MRDHYPYVCQFCGIQGSLNEEIRCTHTDEECLGNLNRDADSKKRAVTRLMDELIVIGVNQRRVEERKESELAARSAGA